MTRRRRRPLLAAATALAALLTLSGCAAPPSYPDESPLLIAGGDATGVYYGYGEQLAGALGRELHVETKVAQTSGSVDNLQRVAAGEATIGFVQGDAAADAVAGRGAFSEKLDVQAVARLYDEYVHIVVRADADIENVADLAGRSVSLGAESSGVHVVAARILDAAGVGSATVTDRRLGLDASIRAFREGGIDAFFWVGGVPTPGIADLVEDIPVRLVEIDAETAAAMNRSYAGVYRLAEFPAGAYGLTDPTATMTVPTFLVASPEASPELISDLTRTLFAARAEIGRSVPVAELLDRRQAIFTGPVPLHPGASRVYGDERR